MASKKTPLKTSLNNRIDALFGGIIKIYNLLKDLRLWQLMY